MLRGTRHTRNWLNSSHVQLRSRFKGPSHDGPLNLGRHWLTVKTIFGHPHENGAPVVPILAPPSRSTGRRQASRRRQQLEEQQDSQLNMSGAREARPSLGGLDSGEDSDAPMRCFPRGRDSAQVCGSHSRLWKHRSTRPDAYDLHSAGHAMSLDATLPMDHAE